MNANPNMPKVEEVAASEISVGDRIFFPNFRKAQRVVTVFREEGVEEVSLWSEAAQWVLAPDFNVRREIEEESGDV